MKKKRKICYITGTRADYGLMENALMKLDKQFDLSLVATGAHLLKEFGYTIREIEKSGLKIAGKARSIASGDTNLDMAVSFGACIRGTAKILAKVLPDIILVSGDKIEPLAGAMAGVALNIPVAHIHGGDQGDGGVHIDDVVRHAITKFAHIHFPATKLSAERIIKMGEERWRVHIIGSPALDDIFSQNFYSKKYIEEKYDIDLKKPLILAIQHPTPYQADEAGQQMRETLQALRDINENTILIYPNVDAGWKNTAKAIKEYEKYDFLRTYKSLPRKDYLSIMKYARVMVGNSSSGTIDAPLFKLPVVNIGTRESVREHAANKIFVPHRKDLIKRAIKKALFDKNFRMAVKKCKNPYGDGRAGSRMVNIFKKIKINGKLLNKRLTY
jgi:GDP/UDP-N,N'-diacetylbacillosamine 2-epimerase (hydrolysing)